MTKERYPWLSQPLARRRQMKQVKKPTRLTVSSQWDALPKFTSSQRIDNGSSSSKEWRGRPME